MATRVTVVGVRPALAQMDAEISAMISQEVRENTLQAFGNVVQATPVDTGNARNSWRVNEFIDETSGYPYASQRVENTTEYIESLNEGTSQQAPPRFIEVGFMQAGFDNVQVEVIPGELD